ncbi:MAG: DUF4430 domain-containing protein [Kurthia sp.]|nr:DUF4430 domain-containing protein [Candidatus Kurthia equi]
MRKSLFILCTLIATLTLTFAGCKVQTVQQYEAEKDANNKVVVVADEEKKTAEKRTADDKKDAATKESENEKNATTEAAKKMADAVSEDNTPIVGAQKAGVTKEELLVERAKSKVETTNEVPSFVPANETKETKKSQLETATTKEKTTKKVVVTKEAKEATPAKEKKQASTTPKSTPVNQPVKTPTKPAENPVVAEKKKEYVTVSIGMKLLTDPKNYAKLPEALQKEQYVPQNGQVVSGKLEIKEGASAWDAILSLCNNQNIHLDYEYKAMFDGMYIKGINHVYEKDVGAASGWMYAVNGKLAPVGVSQYQLEANDVVAVEYSITGGSDLRW